MATKKKASKGKRYTDEQKAEILAFVEAQGRGGQAAAVKKFGVTALTISTWRKKAGGVSAASTKAPKAPKVVKGDSWSKMVALKKEIDSLETELGAKKTAFGKLAASL
jgi:transposase-like protein